MVEALLQTLSHWTGIPWQQVQFAQPQWLLWGAGLIGLMWLLHWFRPALSDLEQPPSSQGRSFRHPLLEQFLQSSKNVQNPQSRSPQPLWQRLGWQLLRLLIAAFLILALAQPELLQSPKPEASKQAVRDIQFVVESSVTFVLPDYELAGKPVSRMEVVKSVLDDFIQQLRGNRFGVSLFAEQAYTLLPLTEDAQAARLSLQRLKPFLAGRTDEGMGEALGLALQQIDQQGTAPNRVVVLISDGLSQPSKIPLSSVVTYAQGMNVPIYTIGIGAGSAKADKRQFSGLNYTPLDPTILKWLAKETGGQYYRVGSGQDLQQVLTQIRQSAGKPVMLPPPPPRHLPLYFWPLYVVVGLVMLYFVLLTFFHPASRQNPAGGQ